MPLAYCKQLIVFLLRIFLRNVCRGDSITVDATLPTVWRISAKGEKIVVKSSSKSKKNGCRKSTFWGN